MSPTITYNIGQICRKLRLTAVKYSVKNVTSRYVYPLYKMAVIDMRVSILLAILLVSFLLLAIK